MVLCEAKPFATGTFGDKVADLKDTDIPTYINNKLKELKPEMKLYNDNNKIDQKELLIFVIKVEHLYIVMKNLLLKKIPLLQVI